jgi:hypothetical protein
VQVVPKLLARKEHTIQSSIPHPVDHAYHAQVVVLEIFLTLPQVTVLENAQVAVIAFQIPLLPVLSYAQLEHSALVPVHLRFHVLLGSCVL